ncbi:hypothetical protein DFH27DRAFT_45001 [Peziza echinospora]|nr:hypothetical protein DFH27DRAFT_45001 [Peziza echinospora]
MQDSAWLAGPTLHRYVCTCFGFGDGSHGHWPSCRQTSIEQSRCAAAVSPSVLSGRRRVSTDRPVACVWSDSDSRHGSRYWFLGNVTNYTLAVPKASGIGGYHMPHATNFPTGFFSLMGLLGGEGEELYCYLIIKGFFSPWLAGTRVAQFQQQNSALYSVHCTVRSGSIQLMDGLSLGLEYIPTIQRRKQYGEKKEKTAACIDSSLVREIVRSIQNILHRYRLE